jgi:hypothetical protein
MGTKGKQQHKRKLQYSGQWKDGMRHGQGRYFFENGKIKFQGKFERGSMRESCLVDFKVATRCTQAFEEAVEYAKATEGKQVSSERDSDWIRRQLATRPSEALTSADSHLAGRSIAAKVNPKGQRSLEGW